MGPAFKTLSAENLRFVLWVAKITFLILGDTVVSVKTHSRHRVPPRQKKRKIVPTNICSVAGIKLATSYHRGRQNAIVRGDHSLVFRCPSIGLVLLRANLAPGQCFQNGDSPRAIYWI